MASPSTEQTLSSEQTVQTTDEETTISTSVTVSSASSSSGQGGKRQRTLNDMFFTQEKKQPPTKKPKLSQPSDALSASGSKALSKENEIQKLNSIPFSMSAFEAELSEEQRRLLTLECETMGKSWLKVLKEEITKPYFLALKRFLSERGVKGVHDSAASLKIYPPPKDIYNWSNTPLGKVKCVIIGQDPYHGPGQAHGLCFSVPAGIAVPPSLRNIYAEIKAEYPDFQVPKHGNLQSWASDGVLMLNTSLTVEAGQAGSHQNKGWEQFTDKVVDIVDNYGGANLPLKNTSAAAGIGQGVVFLAWGNWALKRVSKLSKKKHLILSSVHPSPLSAHRGFMGNGHFKKANEWLEDKYGPDGSVEWCTLDPS